MTKTEKALSFRKPVRYSSRRHRGRNDVRYWPRVSTATSVPNVSVQQCVLHDYILRKLRKINAYLESRVCPSERLLPETTWCISIKFGIARFTLKLLNEFINVALGICWGQQLKSGHVRFLAYPLQFSIHPSIRCYIVRTTDAVVK